jgi:hypothetical protein
MMAAPGSSSAFETDLPMELLNQGWRKFWSRRENRPYFFNRVSGDTMWEMPPIFNHHPTHNSLSDPLGINSNGPGNFNGPPHHVHHPQVTPQHHNPHLVHQPHLQQQGQVIEYLKLSCCLMSTNFLVFKAYVLMDSHD